MKLSSNNKASNNLIYAIAIIIVIVLIAAALAIGSSPQAPKNSEVTVYIDDVKQNVNLTQPQVLDWGSVIAGNVYTKNFTVTNTGVQNLTIMLLTTEPLGTTQTWAYNNSMLPPLSYAQGSLTLTLSTAPFNGGYTWRLLASNNTAVQPTTTPTATPFTPTDKNFTIQLDAQYGMGIKNITVTINTDKFTLMPSDFQTPDATTFTFTTGSTLSFTANPEAGYTFDSWRLDGTPKSSNPLTLPTQTDAFTLTARFFLDEPT